MLGSAAGSVATHKQKNDLVFSVRKMIKNSHMRRDVAVPDFVDHG